MSHKKYVKDCPICEANVKYIRAITTPGITQEEYDRATAEYRKESHFITTPFTGAQWREHRGY